MNPKENLNRTQALGLVLLLVSAFTYVGGWAWVTAYLDHTYVETYQGYDIYYFPNINVYGVDTGGEPNQWRFNSGLTGARNMIDTWLDSPEEVETYRDFTLYRITALDLYYGEGPLGRTANWDNVTHLKAYIDAAYYPTLVYTIHSGGGEWYIYRQGLEEMGDLRYWVEHGETSSTTYDSLKEAKAYAEEWIKAETSDETPTESPGEAESPTVGNPVNGVDPDTIGAFLEAQRLLISAVTGSMGAGLFIIGSLRREDET